MNNKKSDSQQQVSYYFQFKNDSFRGKITIGALSLFVLSAMMSLVPYYLMNKALSAQKEITKLQSNPAENHDKLVSLINQIDSIESAVGITTVFLLFVLLGVMGYASYRLIDFIWEKIKKNEEKLDELAQGNLPEPSEPCVDEWQKTVESLNILSNHLSHVKSFAEEVGRGHFDSEHTVFNNEGSLGRALANMRKSLRDVAEADKIRNWTSEGIAKFADLLRQNSSSLDELSHHLISELVKYLRASQGAIFIHEQNEDVLEMKASYAYDRRKYLSKSIKPGEGLAGQIFLEKESLMITEVPQNYLTITSGLGEALPKSILIVPLKLNESVIGVLELASFQVFKESDVFLVERIAENIASTISNVRVAEETNRLLQESMSSTEQLKSQEEELRQNLEELQTTQDQMQRQTKELQKMQDSLMLEKSMFKVLMEYSPDRLTYKDTECRLLRVNTAKAKRFKMSPEEMIGKTDYDFFPAEHAAKAMKEEKELMERGEPMLDIVEKVNMENGDVIFMNTSRIPFRNELQEMIGTFIITKDITHLKVTESNLESLSKVNKSLLDALTAFSYKINHEGVIKEVYIGAHVNLGIELAGKPFKDVWPNVHQALQSHENKEEWLILSDTIPMNGEAKTIRHYVLPDPVYKNAYWGIAILQ